MQHPRHRQQLLIGRLSKQTANFPDILSNIKQIRRAFTLFDYFQNSPACPANSNIKMQMSMDDSCNAVLLDIKRFMW